MTTIDLLQEQVRMVLIAAVTALSLDSQLSVIPATANHSLRTSAARALGVEAASEWTCHPAASKKFSAIASPNRCCSPAVAIVRMRRASQKAGMPCISSNMGKQFLEAGYADRHVGKVAAIVVPHFS